ncbi:excisionase family DNA-binding protein [Aquibacillus salsiterrae]|uniref:Excisionase family DNA-binding protein n=1 Tax=Aquibacillus salsiterrae TaxID=2950439 RepID=A0A9X3WDJ0_9BACI|nr:excisionase family DNA-binding protein [Aquibacillus salsiterrae]MDC3415459.1 excisionase family DNA-binding protein [Aquibacillus salsiterrae]
MYLTIKETAEYLSMKETTIKQMIMEKKIRAVHDGNQYVIYKDQFNTHIDQIEKYQKLIQDYLNEPIPEDLDVKDED